MTQGLATSVVMSLFLLLTSVIFLFLTSSWTDQSFNTAEAMARQRARVETGIAINSTNESGVACTSYTAQVSNSGEVFIEDFSDMDLLAEYTNASNTKVATRVAHTTDWSVASIAPDTRDPNAWNPGEVATINFTLPSAMKSGEKGTVIVVTPLAILDSNYFSCTCTAGDSGFSDPSAEAADTGGDNDGYDLNPTDAFSDGIAYASNLNGDDDRHRFYNYGFSIHGACAISGIEVRLDWWLDSRAGETVWTWSYPGTPAHRGPRPRRITKRQPPSIPSYLEALPTHGGGVGQCPSLPTPISGLGLRPTASVVETTS